MSQMNPNEDDRPPLAVALEWTSKITTVSVEMVLPGVAGYWLDLRLGTRCVFLVLGAILGFGTALLSLLRMVRPRSERGERSRDRTRQAAPESTPAANRTGDQPTDGNGGA